ncbi:ABC transporter ATP-binding protein [Salsipaludibacter albus]|uniref:ABC transporter ATP-binding protein n=1 Tax=Salsipaludibacter albus TaxID=2849650 RepID=UPI001EE47D92|nr:ABC transporter ATP-binding protein [Salsipaludibacter albus]MBY5163436.1 ABC transporter ATP-binding protein [Salsipaludibacter albus]
MVDRPDQRTTATAPTGHPVGMHEHPTDPIPTTDPILQLDGVTRRYGSVVAVDDVSLQVGTGELLVIVGPSGCGKTTLLQTIAGLTAPDAGRITIAGEVVTGDGPMVPPERRRVGVVFQDHALFPHLTVADNVEFGIARDADRAERRREVLDLVQLRHLADRYPHELSGGEKQRIALARALAPRPAVMLLDEPFSSLDPNLRTALRQQTAAVLRESGTTAVFVTHDQVEALSIGDRVAVLNAGRLEQVDRPHTVFDAPASRFVASFLGEADMVAGVVVDGTADTVVGRVGVIDPELSGLAEVMVRPHEVVLDADPEGLGTVLGSEFRGGLVQHRVRLADGTVLRADRRHSEQLAAGSRVRVTVDAGHPLAAFPAGDDVSSSSPDTAPTPT